MDNMHILGTVHLNIGVGMAKPIKKDETKQDKFFRLKTARLNRLEKILELLSNLSNKQNYDFTAKDIQDLRSEAFALFKKYDKKLQNKEFKL